MPNKNRSSYEELDKQDTSRAVNYPYSNPYPDKCHSSRYLQGTHDRYRYLYIDKNSFIHNNLEWNKSNRKTTGS